MITLFRVIALKRVGALSIAVAAAATAVAALATPAWGSAFSFGLGYTTTESRVSTGASLRIVYRTDAQGRPSPWHRLVIAFPEGTSLDEAAVPACTASDEELMAAGPSACPAETRLGGGTVVASTGFGPPLDPSSLDAHVFHTPGGEVNVLTAPGSDRVLSVARQRFVGASIVDEPVYPPGFPPPDGRSRPLSVAIDVPPHSAAGHPFLLTAVCPSSGRWMARATIDYDDGTSETATSQGPCRPVSAAAPRRPLPRLRLSVRPRRVRAGARTRLRFRVRSTSPVCVGGATISFGSRRVHADSRGAAAMWRRLARPGRYVVRVRQPGCRGASAVVRVVR